MYWLYELLTNPVYIGQGLPDILQDVESWDMSCRSKSHEVVPVLIDSHDKEAAVKTAAS